ncbi:glycosyltransferase [Microbacterium sp. M1A1_1b]|uniref:glycosyltransferase n=1 Tax=Curtobacterium sp. VKM Ac-2922 TaxID=2929475 RepID=UPI001FB28038|nr:glycosyltransferase [Curtobacterium sp. VKM Ac-2922]MCJ1714152.1 glycosyltransferase [Curtobacterium sp. VKM Ac-2922]
MTRGRPERDLVVFAYAYAASERDAVARVIGELASELRRRGRNVSVIGIPAESIVSAGGNGLEKIRRLRSELSFIFRLLGVVVRKGHRLQAFVSVDVPSGLPLVGLFARRLSRGRVRDVAWVMDLYRLAGPSKNILTRARTSVELIALRTTAEIVTIGSCMASRIERLAHRPADVIPLWHRQMERQARFRQSGEPLRLLYSGSARELHPLQGLIAAVADRPGVELLISGSGAEVDRARDWLAVRPASNITIGGFVPETELQRSYGDADLHVVALSEEMTGTCVPSKVYAAMSAGRGVFHLGSASGQAALDVMRADAGVVVPTGDVDSIGRALDSLLADSSAVARQGENASSFFDGHRTVSAGADAWELVLYGDGLTTKVVS